MYIIANWKMNTPSESIKHYIDEISTECSHHLQVVMCPPHPYLDQLGTYIRSTTADSLILGAQNVAAATTSAQTGEVSAMMLAAMSARCCIVGHSERRTLFDETDHLINHKIKHLHQHNLGAILCIGESAHDQQSATTKHLIETSLHTTLDGVDPGNNNNIMIAYEPLWAIGNNTAAAPSYINEIVCLIRQLLQHKWPQYHIPVLYGGGVNTINIKDLLHQTTVDGFLCGGVSLNSASFKEVLQITHNHQLNK